MELVCGMHIVECTEREDTKMMTLDWQVKQVETVTEQVEADFELIWLTVFVEEAN